MFYDKMKDSKFWEEVRTNSAYHFLVDELLEMYQEEAQGEIVDISYEVFTDEIRSGSRLLFKEEYYFPRRRRLSVCALLSLIYPEKEEYLTNLMNTVWAICNEYCWSVSHHASNVEPTCYDSYIDLFAAETGFALSEICFLLGDRMDNLIKERIHKEIKRRIMDSFSSTTYTWERVDNNWSAVCAGHIACTFMYECPELFYAIKPRIDNCMKCFLSGYKEDGVCLEGIAYWQYGFGVYIAYAQRLLEFTGGKVNLFEEEKVKIIGQFPAKIFLDKGSTVSFSDGSMLGRIGIGTISVLRTHYGEQIPMLPMECYTTHHRSGRWHLHLDSILGFDTEFNQGVMSQDATYYMKESEWFVKKTSSYSFAVKGGNNGEPHNHNDVGGFIFYQGGRQVLVDLGCGEYISGYFGPKRYDILCNRSGGHNVPILDGCEQEAGKMFAGSMDFDGNRLMIDIIGAYPVTPVFKFIREFTFTDKSVVLKDSFAYREACKETCPVKERMVTRIEPKITDSCVELDEVRIIFDKNVWKVSVTEDIHTAHLGAKETVYLIDFISETATGKFCVEIMSYC